MQNSNFNHSVKVPKLYKCAAKISQEVARGSSSIKQLVYEKKHFNTKALYALVITTFQKAKDIDLLLKRTKLLEKESRLDPWLAKILISELLWGKKQLPKSDAKPIQTVLAYEQAFHAHLSDSSGDALPAKTYISKKPRYVRINTLINPFSEALELFQEEGWILQTTKNKNNYESFLEQVSNLEGDMFLKDMHVPDLLIFPGGTEFYNHPGYKKGALVLQDKASCLPVHILSPPPSSVVLDMCAAPGMKTTQLATVLQNEGTIYAVERDQKRFEVLNKIVESSGATCIKTINKDVLQCGDSDFPDVEYIIVDPSCSASGMTERLEVQQNQDEFRLQKLAGFQIKILRSALTRYPKVKKVVYSTCSLYPEENEDVVRQVLETNNQFKLVPADNFINFEWKNYGSADFGDIGKFCLYARPEEDLTNGFFVAVFERLGEGENNQFFNGRVLNYRKNVEQKQNRKERKFKEMKERSGSFEESREKLSDSAKKEVDMNVEWGAHIHNNHENQSSKRSKKNEQKSCKIEPLNQDSGSANIEYQQKIKKSKLKHSKVENFTETKSANEEKTDDILTKDLNFDEQATVNENNAETLKKSKKNKRKYSEVDNFKETEGFDKEISDFKVKELKFIEQNISEENNSRTSKRSKKKNETLNVRIKLSK